ncbi:MAG: helix-turn-helix domain-containing protein [Oscillospiraceae bacterium]|nr:helix-turn-helix domain-containing protein [Oscillospiraceae bacterium]
MKNNSIMTDWGALPLVLSAADVGKVLGLSKPSIYTLLNRKDFPTIRLTERRVVVSRDALRRWLEDGTGRGV